MSAKPADNPEPKPVRGGKLTMSLNRDAGGLDPHAGTAVTFNYAAGMYEQLWRQTLSPSGETVPEPWLAESWEFTSPTTLVFKLRQGVMFHDGSEFDAHVAQWNFEHMMAPASKFNTRAQLVALIKSTQVVDSYTFQINLPSPNYLFLEAFSAGSPPGPNCYMVSPAYYERVGEGEMARKPMGTGPFKFVEWVPNDHLTMVRNDSYWGKDSFGTQLPYLDEVIWKPIEDPTAAFNSLRAGTVDWLSQILPTDAQIARNDPKLKVLEDPGSMPYVDFQILEGPFQNTQIRQAFNWGIDREAIHRSVYLGTGATPSTRLPSTHWATDPSEPFYTYDPEKARLSSAK